MSSHRLKRSLALVAVTAATALLAPAAALGAGEAPVKEVIASHFGSEVDAVTKGSVCTVASGHECLPGKLSSVPGGFEFPVGVAVNNDPEGPESGDLYVADGSNRRVQVLTPAGAFVLMFGWDVNKSKVEKGASQAERNLCTAESKDTCQAGATGAAAGQFGEAIYSIAVDASTGGVYVQDLFNWRIQEFTPAGEFLLMIGKGVNETTKANLCTAASKDKCKTGERAPQGSTEPGAFNFAQGDGNLLAVGGSEDLLYVGDEHRVQEFKDGTWVKDIPLTSISSVPNSTVTSLALDPVSNLYLVYDSFDGQRFTANTIRELNSAGEEVKHFELSPEVRISSIALDSGGRLAVSESEDGKLRGALYEVGSTSLHLSTEFALPALGSLGGLAFGDEHALHAVVGDEVIAYIPLPVGELVVSSESCVPGLESETNATVDCSLNGEVNPWNVAETEAWVQWGHSPALGAETGKQPVATGEGLVPFGAIVAGLHPNETVFYRLAGFDLNNRAPEEPLSSETTSFRTETVAPRIVGEPSVSFVHSFSAVMFGEVNPENASTSYGFEYGLCEEGLAVCANVLRTQTLKSSDYGQIATTLEATGLQPATTYRYRLTAVNEQNQRSDGPERSFTTAPAPAPRASTGGASAIGTTAATISGSVTPGGQPASYTFELGAYNGPLTHYGLVISGPAGAGSEPVGETVALTGLQPGTTYAYRIAVKQGTSEPVRGEPATFTTQGLPSALSIPVPLAQLAVPSIAFPAVSKPGASKPLTNARKLAKALKACKKKRSKKQRAACEKQARKKYPKSKQANHRTKG